MYFETPDLKSQKGWGGIGTINEVRLERFQNYLAKRPADALETLISNDKRLRDPKTGLDAYAEAWALTYFLIHQKPKEYVAYLKGLSQKKPLLTDDPKKRLEEFEKVFGNLQKLDEEFLRYMAKIR
jgi:Zn-dependent M32 family carboxypeptidase